MPRSRRDPGYIRPALCDASEPRAGLAGDRAAHFAWAAARPGRCVVASQKIGALFVNGDDVSELWMALVCGDDACSRASWRIVQINN